MGEYDYNNSTDGAQPLDYGIAKIVIYPEYKPPSSYNDLALIKLSSEAPLNNVSLNFSYRLLSMLVHTLL